MPSPVPEEVRALLVDDDADDRAAVRRALVTARITANVHEAVTVEDALRLLHTEPFDFVLLDYYVGGGDTAAVLDAATKLGAPTPAIVLTGQGDEELVADVMKRGAVDYLPKASLSAERLARAIRYAPRVRYAALR